MFKKILGVFALAGLLGAMSSCTDNSLYGNSSDDLVEVTFTITSEGVQATRGIPNGGIVYYPEGEEYPQISDGSKAKRLIWAVYDKEGNLLPELGSGYSSTSLAGDADVAGYGQVVEDVAQFPHTITIKLVRGQEYSLAFWAQDKDCKAFNTKDLRAVSVDYSSAGNNIANDELRDAFCKVETFTVTSAPSMERTIILRRPFAQVNVGIPAAEYKSLSQSGIRIKKSKIHMENVATEFDVVANSTHGDNAEKRQAIDYEYNYIPAYYNYNVQDDTQIPTDAELDNGNKEHGKTQYLKIDLDHNGEIVGYGAQNEEGEDETYNYMLMAYILPADRNDGTSTYSTTLDHIEFSLLPEDEGQTPLTFSLDNVPVQRNWRTNIFGRMFTSDVVLKIDLDPFYAGDYNYPDWERIYEGVTYDGRDQSVHISNGAGLVWLANATNGVWGTADDFENDNSHNLSASANITNSVKLMLKATKRETKGWPKDGIFHFEGVTIKLDADIDLATYGKLFETNGTDDDGNEVYYFTPIAFGNATNFNNNVPDNYASFQGTFDGQNHTIYNLKTVRPAPDPNWDQVTGSYGLFSVVAKSACIENVRLKDVDIESYYYAGGIVGYAYSNNYAWVEGGYDQVFEHPEKFVQIKNCYVDGGTILSTSKPAWYRANNVGGIIGMFYNAGTIEDCFVRNVTLRAYRTIGGIAGTAGGDGGPTIIVHNNKVYDATIIVDQFQDYSDTKAPEAGKLIGDISGAKVHYDKNKTEDAPGSNVSGNVKLYVFNHYKGSDGINYTDIGLSENLSNPPLDIFPRLWKYTDYVRIQTSLLGGPSAYKIYEETNIPDTNSGRVGLWISGITVDGDTDSDPATLDNATITASNVNKEKDCVMFIKDEATIKNLTVHGATYAGQAICLAPASGKTITLENVLAYDATKVLTDDGGVSGGTLTVTGSNFRGYVSLSSGYAITFDETTFEGSSKRVENTVNKLQLAGSATLTKCKFLVEPGQDYVIDASSATFSGCKAYAIGKTDENDGIEITSSCTITVDSQGNVSIK